LTQKHVDFWRHLCWKSHKESQGFQVSWCLDACKYILWISWNHSATWKDWGNLRGKHVELLTIRNPTSRGVMRIDTSTYINMSYVEVTMKQFHQKSPQSCVQIIWINHNNKMQYPLVNVYILRTGKIPHAFSMRICPLFRLGHFQ
jgi:hypothetical protein